MKSKVILVQSEVLGGGMMCWGLCSWPISCDCSVTARINQKPGILEHRCEAGVCRL